ncbi:TraR/DksA family transcriptional regulator [Geodermatophilus sp. SYSU D01186]
MTTAAATTASTRTTDRAPFTELLRAQRADVVRQHELALAETVTSVPDPVAVTRAAGLVLTIEEIDAALARIDAGTYGRCVHCGGGIPTERLEFRPSAAACVSCQRAR